jgi:hypothetical protein
MNSAVRWLAVTGAGLVMSGVILLSLARGRVDLAQFLGAAFPMVAGFIAMAGAVLLRTRGRGVRPPRSLFEASAPAGDASVSTTTATRLAHARH